VLSSIISRRQNRGAIFNPKIPPAFGGSYGKKNTSIINPTMNPIGSDMVKSRSAPII